MGNVGSTFDFYHELKSPGIRERVKIKLKPKTPIKSP